MEIRGACANDENEWRRLWRDYTAFYEADVPETVTAATWRRIIASEPSILCRVALTDGQMLGFSNAVLHEGSWVVSPVCYLEDLFVDPPSRGRGVGRALIADLVAMARDRGWSRLYWHTRADNRAARRLYDEFTQADDFVRYRLMFQG
jgi:GNAT superfamily N-acetyltransferase